MTRGPPALSPCGLRLRSPRPHGRTPGADPTLRDFNAPRPRALLAVDGPRALRPPHAAPRPARGEGTNHEHQVPLPCYLLDQLGRAMFLAKTLENYDFDQPAPRPYTPLRIERLDATMDAVARRRSTFGDSVLVWRVAPHG